MWSKTSGTSGFIAKYHHLLPPSLWQPTIHTHVSIQAVCLSLEASLWTRSSDSVNQENVIIRFQGRQIILESFSPPITSHGPWNFPDQGWNPRPPAMEAQNLNTVPPGKSPRVFLTWIWGAQDIKWEDWYWVAAVIQVRYYWMWIEDNAGGRGRGERTWRHRILMLESCKTYKGRRKISLVSLWTLSLGDAWLVLETQDQNAWRINTEESKKIVLADLSGHR